MNLPRNFASALLVGVFVTVAGTSLRAREKPMTVKGYVLDSACAFIQNLKKPISTECARACAKAGSPLVILADDGTVYWPISDSMPATGQNQRLMQFAGQRVTVKGKVLQRGGSRAMVIEEIEAALASK